VILPRLRAFVHIEPEVWRHYGDLASLARRSWIDLIAGPDLILRESITRKVEELARDLVEPRLSALGRLLVERVKATWLQTLHAETADAQSTRASVAIASFLSKRLDGVNRRLLMSLVTLGTLRRLMSLAPTVDQFEENRGVGEAQFSAFLLPENDNGWPRLRVAGISQLAR